MESKAESHERTFGRGREGSGGARFGSESGDAAVRDEGKPPEGRVMGAHFVIIKGERDSRVVRQGRDEWEMDGLPRFCWPAFGAVLTRGKLHGLGPRSYEPVFIDPIETGIAIEVND